MQHFIICSVPGFIIDLLLTCFIVYLTWDFLNNSNDNEPPASGSGLSVG